jgi:hypothetical protein
MPIPVSETAMVRLPGGLWCMQETVTEPRGVNLSACVRRFRRIRFTF